MIIFVVFLLIDFGMVCLQTIFFSFGKLFLSINFYFLRMPKILYFFLFLFFLLIFHILFKVKFLLYLFLKFFLFFVIHFLKILGHQNHLRLNFHFIILLFIIIPILVLLLNQFYFQFFQLSIFL